MALVISTNFWAPRVRFRRRAGGHANHFTHCRHQLALVDKKLASTAH